MSNFDKYPDRCCARCTHVWWLVALGLGARCGHPTQRVENKLGPLLPSPTHVCELFEPKKIPRSDSEE